MHCRRHRARGAYGDRLAGRDDYQAYLVDTMPKLANYAMAVHRVTYVSEALAFAELAETVELDGKPMLTDQVLVFGFDDDGRITRVEIFIQTPRPLPSPP